VTAAGGRGIAVHCDHADDGQVRQLFEQVREAQGRLDILVNNWNVGMRSHYTATWYAAPLLLAAGGGLVVNTSSFGGRIYMHGPAYGAGKAAVDKMSHDMAVDFGPHNVAVVSIWMGLLMTERTRRVFEAEPDKYAELAATTESPEFTGRIIDALARDPGLMEKSGKVWIGAELAVEYGVVDSDGSQPPSHRAFFGETTTFGDAVVE
jgi:NAD(P)-dependent dehydrogenase (short-subunit alcohol dehydrogenase family)